MNLPQNISIQKLDSNKVDALLEYLHLLSPFTKKRFGPHPFEKDAIWAFYQPNHHNVAYIAVDETTDQIVAYFIVKKGLLAHDIPRLQQYNLQLNPATDFTFAPSIADEWQGRGIGTLMLHYVLEEIKKMGAERLILWGGVQSDNMQAIRFYQKNSFVILGQFEYHGWNTDMMRSITNI